MSKKKVSLILLMPIVSLLAIFVISPSAKADTPLTCNMSIVTGDDDGSFPMLLPFSLRLGQTDYNQVYYSTNGTMSFGQPDGTFSNYPQTPSVSLAGNDWVSWGPGAYTSYGYNQNSFCIEWSVRPFPQSSGNLTQIRLVVNKFANGSWHGEITTVGWLPNDLRRGIRATQGGPVVTMAAAFDVNGGAPIEVAPAPSPTSFTEPPAIPIQCWNGSNVYSPNTCPIEPSFTCWNGSITHYSSECPTEPVVICWDNSQVHYQSECSPTPSNITCWNGTSIPWNQSCPNVPPPIECWDGSSVNWDLQCPTRTLNPPDNVYGEVRSDGIYIYWDTPFSTGTIIERYAVSWQCEGCAGYGWSSTTTSVLIPFSIFEYTGGVGRNYTFSVRADNDTTATYSNNTVGPILFVKQPTPSPEPTQSQSPEPAATPTPQPLEPSPQPSEPVVQPSEPSSPNPTPSLSPSESPLQLEVPVVIPSPTPEPRTSSPEPLIPNPIQSPSPDPIPTSTLPSNNNIIDGLTLEESIALNELLTEYGPMDAVSFGDFEASGLDYENLPPDQPVMLENGVILTAEIADAIEIFESPSELLLTILTDPGKALKAFVNIGADMTPEQRKESQTVVIASIIVGQIISTTNLITGRIR